MSVKVRSNLLVVCRCLADTRGSCLKEISSRRALKCYGKNGVLPTSFTHQQPGNPGAREPEANSLKGCCTQAVWCMMGGCPSQDAHKFNPAVSPTTCIFVLDAGAATCSPAATWPQVSTDFTLLRNHSTLAAADCAHVLVSHQNRTNLAKACSNKQEMSGHTPADSMACSSCSGLCHCTVAAYGCHVPAANCIV